jgi:multisubunit Na+/H+ antiporter MnhF subunit
LIAVIALCGVAAAAALTALRLFSGPTLYDRALAAISVALKAALICAALAVVLDEGAAADTAIALAFAVLVLGVATLKFFRARTFQAPMSLPEDR